MLQRHFEDASTFKYAAMITKEWFKDTSCILEGGYMKTVYKLRGAQQLFSFAASLTLFFFNIRWLN